MNKLTRRDEETKGYIAAALCRFALALVFLASAAFAQDTAATDEIVKKYEGDFTWKYNKTTGQGELTGPALYKDGLDTYAIVVPLEDNPKISKFGRTIPAKAPARPTISFTEIPTDAKEAEKLADARVKEAEKMLTEVGKPKDKRPAQVIARTRQEPIKPEKATQGEADTKTIVAGVDVRTESGSIDKPKGEKATQGEADTTVESLPGATRTETGAVGTTANETGANATTPTKVADQPKAGDLGEWAIVGEPTITKMRKGDMKTYKLKNGGELKISPDGKCFEVTGPDGQVMQKYTHGGVEANGSWSGTFTDRIYRKKQTEGIFTPNIETMRSGKGVIRADFDHSLSRAKINEGVNVARTGIGPKALDSLAAATPQRETQTIF